MRWRVLPWLGIAACHLTAANSAATCDAPWSPILVYTGGMTVSEAGANYQTNWWTQGNVPTTKSEPAGSGRPWTATGICDACALVPTTPATFTAVGTSSLMWTPSSTPANRPITTYALSENGAKVAGVVGSSTTISGLSPNNSHTFSHRRARSGWRVCPHQAACCDHRCERNRRWVGGVRTLYRHGACFKQENLLTIQRNSQIKVFTLAFCPEPGRLFRRLAGGWLDYRRHASKRPHDPFARAVAARDWR